MTNAEHALILRELYERISTRLNNYLCGMKPDYDDSIVGFNEAWDIMRKIFDDELLKLERPGGQ